MIEDENEYEDIGEDFLKIQSIFSETGNYFILQQSINRGYYNSLFKKIEDNENDILVDFFVNSYYLFTNLKEDEPLVIKTEKQISNVSIYEESGNFIFFDKNLDIVEAYDFNKESKNNYINTIYSSILRIFAMSPLFDKKRFNIDKLDFGFQIINLILYKSDKCRKIIKSYKLKKTNKKKYSVFLVELNKKNILKNVF